MTKEKYVIKVTNVEKKYNIIFDKPKTLKEVFTNHFFKQKIPILF